MAGVPDVEMKEVIDAAVRYAVHQAFVRRAAHVQQDAIDAALVGVATAHARYRSELGPFGAYANWYYRGAVRRFLKKERRYAATQVPYPERPPAKNDEMGALSEIAEGYGDEAVDELTVSEATSLEPVFLRRLAHERAARVVTGLGHDDQQLLRLRLVEDEPWPVIAGELGAPEHVLRYRAGKLVKMLRSALAEGEPVRPVRAGKGTKLPSTK